MYNKEKEYLHQIAKASEAIRRKHRLFKLGKENAENLLNETFKPIVETLQKIITINDIKRENFKTERIEKEEKGESKEEDDNLSFKSIEDSESTIIPDFEYDKLLNKYIYLIDHNRKQCLDLVYGVRKMRDGSLLIGDKPIIFNQQFLNVGNRRFTITPGLLELLFKNKPENSHISDHDINNYKQILIDSNAHRKKYSASEPINISKSFKYTNVISNLFPQSVTPKSKSKTGTSLPKFMITKRNFQPDYIYWDDPNELVDRLRLLTASQAAGNPSHNNEIMSIIEELREAKIIY
ncbi:uncharacterized protein LOC127285568 [Leptopilina boulardi]|uniref:uncharacterized protein LOC127285568 n=1 Tax=Leptopilina boulardi TaxID=63433 RepID=UPI0021F69813|nr:uncharacterized protein LOC127285568 [Leptopilina boulardi]